MTDKPTRAAFPTDPDTFEDDDRISFDKVSQTHKLEDENGEEWEWLARPAKWVPVVRISSLLSSPRQALWPAYIQYDTITRGRYLT